LDAQWVVTLVIGAAGAADAAGARILVELDVVGRWALGRVFECFDLVRRDVQRLGGHGFGDVIGLVREEGRLELGSRCPRSPIGHIRCDDRVPTTEDDRSYVTRRRQCGRFTTTTERQRADQSSLSHHDQRGS
jgi:hypothetical protein